MATLGKMEVTLELNIPLLNDSHLGVEQHDMSIEKTPAMAIRELQEWSRQVALAFMELEMKSKPYLVNNWRKRHGIPMRRRVR